MDLVLWRHAEAVDASEVGGDDMARGLTSRGQRQAEVMALWLQARLPKGALVLVSPALRARQTAQALGAEMRIVEAMAPERGGVETLLQEVGWHAELGASSSSIKTVVFVGHQPVLGMTAATLMCGTPQFWAVKKGAVWWLRSRARDGGCELRAVESPQFESTLKR